MIIPKFKVNFRVLFFCGVFGNVLLVLAVGVGYGILPGIVYRKVIDSKVLRQGTEQWKTFMKLPFPFQFKVYLFTIHNPEQILMGEKPIVRETGPYVYKLHRWKDDVVWNNETDEISYYEYTKFEFDQEASGELTDQDTVTLLNIPYLSLLYKTESNAATANFLAEIDDTLKYVFSENNGLFLKTKVKDFLFDGIRMCENGGASGGFIAGMVCKLIKDQVYATKQMRLDGSDILYATLHYKNNSHMGHLTVKSGQTDEYRIGALTMLNNKSSVSSWLEDKYQCNKVDGLTSVFPINNEATTRFTSFSEDICRSIEFEFSKMELVDGIRGYRYVASKTTFSHSKNVPENQCFCVNKTRNLDGDYGCLYDGIIDLSTCTVTLSFASGKIYKRCELARELRNFDVAEDEIPTWVCIAQHESNFDTAAMNYGSGDHGLFQISQLYWCSPPGYGCNSPCSKFRDDDIADDLQCIRRIYNEHKRISGDGFNAWVVYPLYCKGDNAKYVQDCYDGEPDIASNTTENEITTEEVDEYGDGYQFPALPSSSEAPKSEYGDGYEFPKLPYSEASIHRFVPAKNDSAQRVSKIIKLHKMPYSKSSIHSAVLAGSNGTYSKLPYSKISINYAVPAHEKLFRINVNKLPYSKESIHHFIPVKGYSPKATEEPGLSEDSHTISSSTAGKLMESATTLLVSSTTEKAATTTRDDRVPPLPVSTKLTELRTSPRTTTKTHFTAAFDTSTAKSSTVSNSIKNYDEKVAEKSSFSTSTTNYKAASTLSGMKEAERAAQVTTTKTPLTTTTFKTSTSSKSATTDIKTSLSTTVETPLAFAQSSVSTRLEQRIFLDLEGASSTFSPLRQNYNPSTSSMKPLTTPRYHVPTKSTFLLTTTSNKVFPYKAFTVTTPTTFSNISTTKKPTKSFRDYKHPTPSDFPFTTTTKPSERQITFAPDSFFSWLFSSQTLPPLVAPPRPQRPQGGPPNFPRPGSPLGGPNFGIPRPPATPQVPGQPITTRRPFPLRPSASRPNRRPFASEAAAPRPPSPPPRRPLRPNAEHSAFVMFREAPKQVGVTTEFSKGRSFTAVNSTVSTGRAVEVKLDDNFVFVRTKYGYRLFRV